MKDVYILGIETSCDETAAAIIKNGGEVLSNVIYSQIELHTSYGGVVPEIASRKHIEKISQVVEAAIEKAGIRKEDITAVAVTYGPGLIGALLVGVSFAKAFCFGLGIDLIPVHHIEGHISANFIEHPDLEPPFICLVASGGHSHLVHVKEDSSYEIVGQTRDDAVGEAFDKVARAIGLGYPGGPKMDAASQLGDMDKISFPRCKVSDNPYDFSFSGIKTAVLNYVNQLSMKNEPIPVNDIAASFQKSVVEVLVEHSICAARDFNVNRICIAGGVAANSYLRKRMLEESQKAGIDFYLPSLKYCTDNAVMIGINGYSQWKKGCRGNLDLNGISNLKIGEKGYVF